MCFKHRDTIAGVSGENLKLSFLEDIGVLIYKILPHAKRVGIM